MNIVCIIDVASREVTLRDQYRIAAYDHNVDVIQFSLEPVEDFAFDLSSIRIAAQGPNKARHDYAVDPSTVSIEEETGYITFDWPIPQGVTEMPIGTFKYGDRGQLIFSVCAEIITGSTLSKAWHSDDGIITVVAHLEPEAGGGEDPSEEATNAQKIGQLQTDVAVINTQVGALANGSPTPVETVAEMTDESAVYLYTGSETGYTAGNWYYYNGSEWTSGGTYGGAVTSTTFTEHGVPADDFAVGEALADKADADDVTALEGSIEAIEDAFGDLNDVSFPSLTWTIGKTVGSSGSAGNNLYGAMTNEILVLGGESVIRKTPIKDSNDNTLTVHVCQYKNGTFQSRTSLTSANMVLDADTTSVVFNFSRTSSSGVQMTAEDISTYFRDVILRKLVAEADYKPAAALNLKNVYITESQAQTEYANLAASLPLNTYSWVGRAWFNDVPTDLDSYIWIFTLSANNRTDAITQIAFAPKSNFSYSRRLQSGSFTEWKSSKDAYSSNPVYYAYGDSLTWGAVWDNDQSSVYYQAGLNDQIPTRIAHAIGSTQFTNKGVSGARFVPQGSSDTTTIIGDVIKADNLSGVNIVTIGGGRNDSATSLGNGDTATANDGTICGAVVDILEYLTTNYPKLQIVMYGVTPQPTTNAHAPSDIFTRVFSGGWSLNTYYTEMRKVCARYGVPFIDWYDCTLILRWGVLSGGYSSGVQNWSHPLESNIYKQMGNYLAGKVSSYYTG